MTTDTPRKPNQTEDIAKLREEIGTLRMLLDDMRQRTELTNVLDNGLAALNDKLAPLSSFLRRGEPLTPDESATLKAIRASLRSPDYTDLEEPLVIGGDRQSPATTGGKPS
jgi:hypothetical protein